MRKSDAMHVMKWAATEPGVFGIWFIGYVWECTTVYAHFLCGLEEQPPEALHITVNEYMRRHEMCLDTRMISTSMYSVSAGHVRCLQVRL